MICAGSAQDQRPWTGRQPLRVQPTRRSTSRATCTAASSHPAVHIGIGLDQRDATCQRTGRSSDVHGDSDRFEVGRDLGGRHADGGRRDSVRSHGPHRLSGRLACSSPSRVVSLFGKRVDATTCKFSSSPSVAGLPFPHGADDGVRDDLEHGNGVRQRDRPNTTNNSSTEQTLVRSSKIFYLNDGVPDPVCVPRPLWSMDPNGANNTRSETSASSGARTVPRSTSCRAPRRSTRLRSIRRTRRRRS